MRLTYKDDNDYKLLRGRECQWKKKIKEEYETIDNSIQKLGQLEDLEEQIGCPLDVLFKAVQDGVYCEDVTNRMQYLPVDFHFGLDGEFMLYCNDDEYLLVKNYKKTWWLKLDKSK